MRKHQCPKCRKYFERRELVIIDNVGVCKNCSSGNDGIRKKGTYKRYNTIKREEIIKPSISNTISPLLERYLIENGYKLTKFGVYRKLGNGCTEVYYYNSLDELERRFEKDLHGGSNQ